MNTTFFQKKCLNMIIPFSKKLRSNPMPWAKARCKLWHGELRCSFQHRCCSRAEPAHAAEQPRPFWSLILLER
jgi:hypothetical protein